MSASRRAGLPDDEVDVAGEAAIERGDVTGALDRWVSMYGAPEDFLGETRCYVSRHSTGRQGSAHADPDCPNFPVGPVKVYPITTVREYWGLAPCSVCTTNGGDR